jgi:hypothetical protein
MVQNRDREFGVGLVVDHSERTSWMNCSTFPLVGLVPNTVKGLLITAMIRSP